MFDTRGLRWKRLRNLMSGSFSVNNLRGVSSFFLIVKRHVNFNCHTFVQMAVMSDRSAKTFAQRAIAENSKTNGEGFDIYPFCQDVTLEVIAQVAFGDERQLQGFLLSGGKITD